MKLTFTPISPLVFLPAVDDPSATALRFTQRFGRYDTIRLHAIGDESTTITMRLYNAVTGALVATQGTTRKSLDGNRWLYRKGYVPTTEGMFYMTLTSTGGQVWRSVDFEITHLVEDDPEWVLFEYGGTRNDTPIDPAFVLNGAKEVFKLRLPAGFKPQGWEPAVETETYRTQSQELRVLYSVPYEKWALTVGGAAGMPVEYLRILNAVLSCEIVYINGVRMVRSEGSMPEKQLTMTGAQMFTASVTLEAQPSLQDYPNELYGDNGSYNDDYNADYDVITT